MRDSPNTRRARAHGKFHRKTLGVGARRGFVAGMQPRDTAAVYDRIGHHWTEPSFPATNGIVAHERALAFLARSRGGALDAGCGANGRLRTFLRANGFAVEGVDVSARMIELARRAEPETTFHHADICEWSPPRAYDFITAWDSIWHVPLDRQLAVVAKLVAALAPGGVLIFTSGGLDEPNEVTNPCHGVPLYHATPGVPAILRTLREAGATLRHFEFDQWPESHVYFVAQRR